MGTESLVGFVVDCSNPRAGSPGMLVSFIVGDAAAKYGAATKEQRREVVLRDLAAVYGAKVCGAGAAAVPPGWCARCERWRAVAVCRSGAVALPGWPGCLNLAGANNPPPLLPLRPQAESEAIGYDEGHWPADPWAGGSVFMLTPGTWTNVRARREAAAAAALHG